MTPQLLEQMFGKQQAKIYIFGGSVPEGKDPYEHVTVEFSKAVKSNLINCNVTNLQSMWVIYTQDEHQIDDEKFRLHCELPLPEPTVIQQETTEETNDAN